MSKQIKRSITIEDCQKVAADRGGECLSSVYVRKKDKLLWRCSKGHEWLANFDNVDAGTWCKRCFNEEPIKHLDQVRDLISERGGVVVRFFVDGVRSKVEFICQKSHLRISRVEEIMNGRWCPECLKYDLCEIKQAVFERFDGYCVSSLYNKRTDFLEWSCKHNHTWIATVQNVMAGYWCSECAGNKRGTLDKAQKTAERFNGKCLSSEYVNARSDMKWECSNRHTWTATYHEIDCGVRCPECRIKGNQGELFYLIKNIFKDAIYNFRGFSWLARDGRHRMEIDIWVPSIKLAIEYDGEQHFIPIDFCGRGKDSAEENFKKIKGRDIVKDKIIKQHESEIKYFIRFSYKEKITKEYVIEKLKNKGVLDV